MTDIFRSEILAAVLQQIVEERELPTLFMRTILQTVSTYKSLVPFVSTALLSRLITKKVWTDARLWEGFILCAKRIAPASYNALLQLPKDQLRNLVEKESTLKTGLREFVLSRRPGSNKNKLTGYLEILGDDVTSNPSADVNTQLRQTTPQTPQMDGPSDPPPPVPSVSTPTMA
jgi:symplekin